MGLTSFGGPIAHLGYFHRELVERRRWIDEGRYAQLLALCQFLPGPASSQLGFALGLIRAGWRGALAAFVAFTLPSALLMFAFAHYLPKLAGPYGQAVIHGLKWVAIIVVARGLWIMARRLTPDLQRALIAAAAGIVVLSTNTALAQLLVIVMGAIAGWMFCRHVALPGGVEFSTFDLRYGTRTGGVLIGIFAILLLLALAATSATTSHWPPLAQTTAAFYRAGALVFGGGHVVLPLLEEAVVEPGWIGRSDFLAGYGAAQAVPGPMFSVAAFLGARLDVGVAAPLAAAASLIAIFLPGLLLVTGTLPFWRALSSRRGAVSALAGVNAAVVGLLAAALFSLVRTALGELANMDLPG